MPLQMHDPGGSAAIQPRPRPNDGPPPLARQHRARGNRTCSRRWTINGRFLAQPRTGVQRYAFEIVGPWTGISLDNPALAAAMTLEIVAPPDASAALELEAIPIRRVGRLRRPPMGAVGAAEARTGRAPQPLQLRTRRSPPADRLHPRPEHPGLPRELFAGFPLALPCPAAGARAYRRCGYNGLATIPPRRSPTPESERAAISLLIPNGHEHVARWQPRPFHGDARRRRLDAPSS